MDRNHVIGFILIFATLFIWTYTAKPPAEVLEAKKRERDSLALLQSLAKTDKDLNHVGISEVKDISSATDTLAQLVSNGINDSVAVKNLEKKYGVFASASQGGEEFPVLENDLIRIEFSNKGGFVRRAIIKQHYKTVFDQNGKRGKILVELLESPNNKFEYLLPVKNTESPVSTGELYFTTRQQGNELSFTLPSSSGGSFVQEYRLAPDDYTLEYRVIVKNLGNDLSSEVIQLNWINYLKKLEVGDEYEQRNSTIYFKEANKDKTDYCSCTSDDKELLENNPIEWISHANQYFNSSLLTTDKPFAAGILSTQMLDIKNGEYLKINNAILDLAFDNVDSGIMDMKMYIGPNEFERLRAFGNRLDEIISFGPSIFGSINRWVIRPSFDILSKYIGSKGLVIILLIFILKMLLYPLLYKMLYSQAKMSALKPELAHLKTKFKDDLQKQQVETMKIYQEYGVSPFGGCLPMVLQMPIWFALYRFFPASITFRQESFLWAPDLSSYDAFINLPFTIPFMGSHLSLFTLLWALSTLLYTYYSSKHIDMSANPAMKYVQYFMPLMFLGFFNSFASGLTCYMFFSNLINIIQTLVTKHFILDENKIRQELELQKAKPKKKSRFQQRLEEAMKEQQRLQAQRAKNKK